MRTMASRRNKQYQRYQVFLFIFILQFYNGALLGQEENTYAAKVQSSLREAEATTEFNRLQFGANTKDKSPDASSTTIDETYENLEIDLGPSRENAFPDLREQNPSKVEDIFPKNHALQNTGFGHTFGSSLSDDFRLTMSSLRSELMSSISSWSISNFDYAGIPTAQAEFRDNVDYYFIDDVNSTHHQNLQMTLNPIGKVSARTTQTIDSSTATPIASQIAPTKTQPMVISHIGTIGLETMKPITNTSAIYEQTSISVIGSSAMRVVDSSTVSVGDSIVVSVADPTAVSVGDSTVVSVADPTTVSVADPTAVSVADSTTVSVADPTTVSVADPTRVSVADPTTVSVADSTAVSNDSLITVTTNKTLKIPIHPLKENDFNVVNEIKPSHTQRVPTSGSQNNPGDGNNKMEYHHLDTISLQSSMTSPTLVYVSLIPDVKQKTFVENINVTRAAARPVVIESNVGDTVQKTEEPRKEFTIENIPISSNLIKYTYDMPKVIEPKNPYTRYPDKVKPSHKVKTTTIGKLPSPVTSFSLVTTLHVTEKELQTKSPSLKPTATIPSFQATISSHSEVNVVSKVKPPTVHDFKVLVNITLSSSWRDFCSNRAGYQSTLANIVRDETKKNVSRDQIKFLDVDIKCSQYKDDGNHRSVRETNNINVLFLVQNEEGQYDETMTLTVGKRLKSSMNDFVGKFGNKLLHVSLLAPSDDAENGRLTKTNVPDFSSTSVITGVVLSVIAAICLITLSVVLLVVKQKSAQSTGTLPPNMMDGLNMDSFPGRGGSARRKRGRLSLRSFLNQAFDEPEYPSHPLSFSNLTNAINNKILLEEEFKKLPITVPSLEEVPEGAETKNRYANVIPNPDTRVILSRLNNEDHSDYINANYVKGYGGKPKEYIATQGPLPETVNDFWRMVWEQQSRMILMLTQLEENGASRCAPYFPDNTHDCNRAYGDFQVSLQSKDVRENFVVSTFKLYEIERNLFREVIHLWYTAWPAHRVPEDHSSLLSFILETRNHAAHRSSGPLIVHCSPGTGRTGALIAIDILMKEYEENRLVDVQRCVSRLKHERYGAVHNAHQYILIHEVLHDFIVKMGTQSQRPSLKSLMSLKLH